MEADVAYDRALGSSGKKLTLEDVVRLVSFHSELGLGGLLLKGHLSSEVLTGLREKGYGVVSVSTSYEGVPHVSLISWS